MQKAIPVETGFTEQGWFSLRMPPLLLQKTRGSVDYLRDFSYPAMQDFFQDKPPVQYPDCVLIFRRIYSRDRPERQWRDYSNIETNLVTDVVAFYVMPGNGPKVCDHHYCSASGEDDHTEVYVVPRTDFTRWLELYDNLPKHPEKPM